MKHIKSFNEKWFGFGFGFNKRFRPYPRHTSSIQSKREEENGRRERTEKHNKHVEEQNSDKQFVQNLLYKMKSSESEISDIKFNINTNSAPNRIDHIKNYISCNFDGDKIEIFCSDYGSYSYNMKINNRNVKCNEGPIVDLYKFLCSIYQKKDEEDENNTLNNFRNKYKAMEHLKFFNENWFSKLNPFKSSDNYDTTKKENPEDCDLVENILNKMKERRNDILNQKYGVEFSYNKGKYRCVFDGDEIVIKQHESGFTEILINGEKLDCYIGYGGMSPSLREKEPLKDMLEFFESIKNELKSKKIDKKDIKRQNKLSELRKRYKPRTHPEEAPKKPEIEIRSQGPKI